MNTIILCAFLVLHSNPMLTSSEMELEQKGYPLNAIGLKTAFEDSIQLEDYSLFNSVFWFSHIKNIPFLSDVEALNFIYRSSNSEDERVAVCTNYLVKNYINQLGSDEILNIYSRHLKTIFDDPRSFRSRYWQMATIEIIAKECEFIFFPYCAKYLLEKAGLGYLFLAFMEVKTATPEISDDFAYYVCGLYEDSLDFKEFRQYFITKKERLEKSGRPVVSKEELLREINEQISGDIEKIRCRKFPKEGNDEQDVKP